MGAEELTHPLGNSAVTIGDELWRGSGESGERFYLVAAVKERDDADDAEGTIYEAPTEGNSAHAAGKKRERQCDQDAGDDAEFDDPDVFDGVRRYGPIKATARTMCAKASQSVP